MQEGKETKKNEVIREKRGERAVVELDKVREVHGKNDFRR